MFRSLQFGKACCVVISSAVGLFVTSGVQATPGYCLASSGTQTTDPIATSDVSFLIGSTINNPIDCYGIVDTGSSNVADNLTFVNSLSWQDFAGGIKDDTGGGSNSATVDDIAYTLSTGTLLNPGTLNSLQQWTLSWSDTNGATAPNLPVTVDFALQWNGGNQDVFYLFDDVVLPIDPSSGTGTIDVKVTNRPGISDIGTSHLSVYLSEVKDGDGEVTPPLLPVPEPGTLSLIGLAALLLAGASRFRRGGRTG